MNFYFTQLTFEGHHDKKLVLTQDHRNFARIHRLYFTVKMDSLLSFRLYS